MTIKVDMPPDGTSDIYLVHTVGNGDNYTEGQAGSKLRRLCYDNDVALVETVIGNDDNRAAIMESEDGRCTVRTVETEIGREIKNQQPDALVISSGHSTGGQAETMLTFAANVAERAMVQAFYDVFDYVIPIDVNHNAVKRFSGYVDKGMGEFVIDEDKFIYSYGNNEYIAPSEEYNEIVGGNEIPSENIGTGHNVVTQDTYFGPKAILPRLIDEHNALLD